MFVLRDNNVMPALVTTFSDRIGLADRASSEYSQTTIATIGETDDLSSQAFTPSVLQTLTMAEAGGQVFLNDSRVDSDPMSVRNDASIELGTSMSKKINTDLLGTFSSLTGGTVGSAGTTITWGHFFAALSQLRNTNAPRPYVAVMHHYQWHQLAKSAAPAATVTNAPMLQDEIARQWWVANVGGVDIFTTGDITVDGSDDATGAMYSRQAIALDIRRAPRMEPERDASRRGWELNLTSVYGYGIWRPAVGIQLVFDAAAPSS